MCTVVTQTVNLCPDIVVLQLLPTPTRAKTGGRCPRGGAGVEHGFRGRDDDSWRGALHLLARYRAF